jgi:hypothetical protein
MPGVEVRRLKTASSGRGHVARLMFFGSSLEILEKTGKAR